jgi:hypothetical protein
LLENANARVVNLQELLASKSVAEKSSFIELQTLKVDLSQLRLLVKHTEKRAISAEENSASLS